MLSNEMIYMMESGGIMIVVSYVVLSFVYRFNPSEDMNKMKSFRRSVPLLLLILALKLGYDQENLEPNLYEYLQVSRHSSPYEIRQAYKFLSLSHHPDKHRVPNNDGKEFYAIKAAYDILKDENSRDTYNRFGAGSLEFDPRLDEIMLFVDIGTVYLFWAVVMYIFTIPVGSRASRTWIAMVGVSVVVVHFLFTIGEVSLPELLKTTPMLATLTEHECILLLNSILPVVIVTLVFLAESMYFDLNRYTLMFLEKSVNRNKELQGVLEHMRELANKRTSDEQVIEETSQALSSNLDIAVGKLTAEDVEMANILKAFKGAGASNATNYYGIIFIVIFVVAQMM